MRGRKIRHGPVICYISENGRTLQRCKDGKVFMGSKALRWKHIIWNALNETLKILKIILRKFVWILMRHRLHYFHWVGEIPNIRGTTKISGFTFKTSQADKKKNWGSHSKVLLCTLVLTRCPKSANPVFWYINILFPMNFLKSQKWNRIFSNHFWKD